MTNQIQVDKIISYMVAQPTISAVVGNRIYFGEPVSDNVSGIYITINIVSESQAECNKGTLLEYRFIGNSQTSTYRELMNARKIVSDAILAVQNFDGFIVYNVREEAGLSNIIDEKGRKIVLQDYRFYFVN